MLSSSLRYLRIILISLSGFSYLIVLLCLTVIQELYYGDFIFLGSVFIILFFLTEGIRYRLMRAKQSNTSDLKS